MNQRLDAAQQSPALYTQLIGLSVLVKKSSLGHGLVDLVQVRASQLNGCAFCLDMHVKEATIHGERALRLHHVAIWRESALFSPRERAALAWTEVLTRLPEHGVCDGLYDSVRAEFSDPEITELSFAVMTINAWNRLSIGFRNLPGSADQAYGLDKAGLV